MIHQFSLYIKKSIFCIFSQQIAASVTGPSSTRCTSKVDIATESGAIKNKPVPTLQPESILHGLTAIHFLMRCAPDRDSTTESGAIKNKPVPTLQPESILTGLTAIHFLMRCASDEDSIIESGAIKNKPPSPGKGRGNSSRCHPFSEAFIEASLKAPQVISRGATRARGCLSPVLRVQRALSSARLSVAGVPGTLPVSSPNHMACVQIKQAV